jgi:hypothetical protein
MPDGTTTTRKSKLLAVAPDSVEPRKPKVLIYGAPGVGKTWASLDFPSVYYIDTEGGADLDHYRAKLRNSGGAYMGPDNGSLDFDIVISQIQALGTEEHHYRTVVIDSISKLWNMALTDEQEALGAKDVFGAYKKLPGRKFSSLVKWVQRLDLTVIFIAHQKDLWGPDDKGIRGQIGYEPDVQEKLQYDLHLSLRIAKLGPRRAAFIGKSRLTGFVEGDNFDWSYANFAERYGKDVIEKKATTLVLATPEQVQEVKNLLEVVKVPEDWAAKCFKKADVDDWSEMNADIIAKVIDSLKAKLVTA